MSKILYIVDMQADFMPFDESKLGVPGADATIEPYNEVLRELDPKHVSFVVVSEDCHAADFVERMPDGTPFPTHCVVNTPGQKTIVDLDSINPRIPVFVIRKNAFDVFEEPTLAVVDYRTKAVLPITRDALFADALASGLKDVELGGVTSDICVNKAGKGLLDRGFNVTVRRSCTKGLFREIDQVNAEDWGGRAILI